MNKNLKEIFQNHRHYVVDKWESYLEIYQNEFSDFQAKKGLRLLEIGVQNGGSLEIWEKFFLGADLIVGCDIDIRCGDLRFSSGKVKIVIGDSCSPSTKRRIKELSDSYDIIIDDGAHSVHNVVCNFFHYFPLLSETGIYVIEDLHCSYWKEFNLVPGKISSIEFLKILIDMLNLDFWEGQSDVESRIKKRFNRIVSMLHLNFTFEELMNLTKNLYSVSFYNSLCILKKRKNGSKLGKRLVIGQEAPVNKEVLFFRTEKEKLEQDL